MSRERLDQLAIRLDALRDEARHDAPVEDSSPELWRFLSASFALSAVGWVSLFAILSALTDQPLEGLLETKLSLGWSVFGVILGLSGVCALALGKFSRWIAAHHLCHKGYDQARGLPRALRSDHFGQRGLAWLLWVDWMPTSAWIYEHNVRHHSYTNTPHSDPDFVEEKSTWLRELKLPVVIKLLIFSFGSLVWKPLYYGPNTVLELNAHREVSSTPSTIYSWAAWSPLRAHMWRVALRSWTPYLMMNFALPTLLAALYFGAQAVAYTLVHLCIAEGLTNCYSFAMIVPNHAGADLYRFDGKSQSRGEYYLRQILSSCNYHTGHPVIDFLHGYLNYQIEHHLWPQLTMGQYRRLQPHVKALCAELDIPYVQGPVWSRIVKLARLSTGLDDAPLISTRAPNQMRLHPTQPQHNTTSLNT